MEVVRWLIFAVSLVAVVLIFLPSFSARKDILLILILVLPLFGRIDKFDNNLGMPAIFIQIFMVVLYIGIFYFLKNRIVKLVFAIILLLQSIGALITLFVSKNQFVVGPQRMNFSSYELLMSVIIIVALIYAIFSYSKKPNLIPINKFHCPSCGEEIEPDSKFCTSCGSPIAK